MSGPERPGLDVRVAVSFRGLDNISGATGPHFSVPDQVVTMQASYDAELEARFQGQHNLWVLCHFPAVPSKRPNQESPRAADLVRGGVSERSVPLR